MWGSDCESTDQSLTSWFPVNHRWYCAAADQKRFDMARFDHMRFQLAMFDTVIWWVNDDQKSDEECNQDGDTGTEGDEAQLLTM